MVHQTPLIKGVNDDPLVLNELLNEMSYLGVTPYYVFQCRPTSGNRTFAVPLERAFEIFGDGPRQMFRSRQACAFRHVPRHRQD